MTGTFPTGTPPEGPFTPYRYGLNAQNVMFHWDPNPGGGYPSGGAAAYIFVHGGNFTSGSGSQTVPTWFGLNDTELQRADSDDYPIHQFNINVRQARGVFSQANFYKRRYPSWASDVTEAIEDVIQAVHFVKANYVELNVNPELIAVCGNSAGSVYSTAACYHPDAKLSSPTGRRLDRRATDARPPIIMNQNTPYMPYLLAGSTLIDMSMLSGIYATGTSDRNARWSSMLPEINEISPYLLAQTAYTNEGYTPYVGTAYDNNEFEATIPANFTENTAHTAVCGYHFHKQLDDTFGYADASHHLAYTGSVPGGATEPWAQNTWGSGDYDDFYTQLKTWYTALGYAP